jgi:hypothetical protein
MILRHKSILEDNHEIPQLIARSNNFARANERFDEILNIYQERGLTCHMKIEQSYSHAPHWGNVPRVPHRAVLMPEDVAGVISPVKILSPFLVSTILPVTYIRMDNDPRTQDILIEGNRPNVRIGVQPIKPGRDYPEHAILFHRIAFQKIGSTPVFFASNTRL